MIRLAVEYAPLTAQQVAMLTECKRQDKHDWMLSEETLNIVFAARNLDIDVAYDTIRRSAADKT